MEYLENKFFLLAFTFGVFFLSRVLQKKTGWVVLNPILLTIAVLILFLKFTGISYEIYNEGGHLIEFWLKPAVVALGVPLYLQLFGGIGGCGGHCQIAGSYSGDYLFIGS